MLNKILFSTKYCRHDSSDVVGGALPQILFAEFFKKKFSCNVSLHDPFFSSKEKLINMFDEIIDDSKINFFNYERIINPLFYVSDLINIKNNNKINVEGMWKKTKRIYLNNKISELGVVQRRSFLNELKYRKDIFIKTFDIPYIYYYDWLKRENFISNLDLKNKIELPITKKNSIYSLQIRPRYTRGVENQISKELYENFIFSLVKKIQNQDKRSKIILYGCEEIGLVKQLKNKNCIYLEDFTSSPLERAIALNKVNYSFSSINGFTYFANYLALSKNNLKKINIINDVENFNQAIHSRRHLAKGIQEDSNYTKSDYFGNFNYYPGSSILHKKINLQSTNKDLILSKFKIKNNVAVFSADYYKTFFFDKKIDNLILKKYYELLKKSGKNKIFTFFDTNNLKLKKNIFNKKFQILLTHYRLKNKNNNVNNIGYSSIDFCKPKVPLIKQFTAGNFIYDDLLNFIVRKSNEKKNYITRKNFKKNEIIIINKPDVFFDLDIKNSKKKFHRFIKNLILKNKENNNKDLWKEKTFKLEKVINSKISYLYQENDKLIFIKNYKKKEISLNEKYLFRIIKTMNLIICGENNLSILINFLFSNKKRIVLYSKNPDKKILQKKQKLFLSDPDFSYIDIFKDNFTNFKELILSEYNKYVEKI